MKKGYLPVLPGKSDIIVAILKLLTIVNNSLNGGNKMSLTLDQQATTIKEFKQALQEADLTVDDLAIHFPTSPEYIESTLNLQPSRLEVPWILKVYLNAQIYRQGGQPIQFSALEGDPHQYCFLDSRIIDKCQLQKGK